MSNKTVIQSDMPEYMQQDCFDCGLESMERCKEESKIAEYIKKEFDRKYNQTWHCIVGSAFAIDALSHMKRIFISALICENFALCCLNLVRYCQSSNSSSDMPYLA